MSSRSSQADRRRKRKLITFLWIAVLTVGVISLIYWEQTALLYILATLGITALLVVVAVSDLHRGENTTDVGPTTGGPKR
jgi:hypothetical protein